MLSVSGKLSLSVPDSIFEPRGADHSEAHLDCPFRDEPSGEASLNRLIPGYSATLFCIAAVMLELFYDTSIGRYATCTPIWI